MNAADRRSLRLTLFPGPAGGLSVLLSDNRSLALHARLVPRDGWQRWLGGAWQAAAAAGGLLGFGQALAQALLPEAVRTVLARHPGGWLHLQLDPALIDLPWELAALSADPAVQPAWHLDQRFTVVRQVMAQAAPAAPLRHREPGAVLQVLHSLGPADPGAGAGPQPGRFGPLLLRVHARDQTAGSAWHQAAQAADIVHLHGQAAGPGSPGGAEIDALAWLASLPTAPRLVVLEPTATRAAPPGAPGPVAAAACRLGLSALVLTGPAPQALDAFYACLASGASFGVAAQQARSAARAAGSAGADAWFYGDGPGVPLQAGATAAPAGPGLASRSAAPTDDMRQITILSCDLVGSTGLMHSLGAEEYSERLTHYHRRVAELAQRFGGLADDPQGDDGFMCYFGYPSASEDAAAQALRAALALGGGLAGLGLQVRIGVSTGRVVIRQAQPVGSAVHLAARLQQQAGPGEVWVAEATRQITGERFSFDLVAESTRFKGFEDGTPVYRLLKERPTLGTERFDSRTHLSPFTGREVELARLQQHWQVACSGKRQALLLRGEAGIGKSRLVREFRRSLADAGHRTLECRCAPEHANSPFQPMIDLLRNRLKLSEADPAEVQLSRLRQLQITTGAQADHALALLGRLMSLPADCLPPLQGAPTPERLRQQTMDLLVHIAQGLDAQAPVCLLVEDVHWIDPSTRALLQRLIDGPPQQRVLLLLTLRSGPADPAPGAGFDLPELLLGGLDAEAARALLQGAIGLALLGTELAGWLTQRADGVPLFIEESARMAAALSAQLPASDITASLRESVPATLQDLLMARLDQLPRAKRAAQLGSALGRHFNAAQIEAVNAHADSPIRLADLARALDELVQAGLLTLQADGGQRGFVFKHALVRDAAYQSMLERDRRRLHASIAAVLGGQFSGLCGNRPELLAHHLEQAGLVAEAQAGWEQAARHAAQRSAHGEASAHLRRALALLAGRPGGPQRDRDELRLQRLLAGRLIATGGDGAPPLGAVYHRALALCQAVDDRAALTQVRMGLGSYHFMRGDFAQAAALAGEVAASLGPASDPLLRLQSGWAQARLLFHQGQAAPALALMDQCLADHLPPGQHPVAVPDPALLCLCYSAWALWQLGRADDALQRARQAVQWAEQAAQPFSVGVAHGFLALVHHCRGEPAAGLAAAEHAIEACASGGFAAWLAHARLMQGSLAAELGQLDAGLAALQQGHAAWAASGAVVNLPFYLSLQAAALALAGEPGPALACIAQALALTDRHGERCHQAELLRLQGLLLLQRGEAPAIVESCLRRSLAVAQARQLQGQALKSALSLGQWLAGQGQPAEACRLLDAALRGLPQGQDTRDHCQARASLALWRV